MINQRFIEEHANNLIELRDIDEIKLYCKANGFEIKDQELESLKTSMQTLVNRTSDSQLLKLEDLADVSGGLTENQAMGIAIGVGVVATIAGIFIPAAVGAGKFAAKAGLTLAEGFKTLSKSNTITGIMLGSAFMGETQRFLEGDVQSTEGRSYQQKYAEEYAESAHGNNQCG